MTQSRNAPKRSYVVKFAYSYLFAVGSARRLFGYFAPFLQAYAIAAGLFMDGNGYLEKDENGNPLFSASEKSQWLFACGYYG